MLETKIYDLNIEQSVLAALMTVSNSYSHVESLLTDEDFHSTRHKSIFQAVVDLDTKNSPYDAVLVNDWLKAHNMTEQSGGEEYLMQIMKEAPSSFYNLVPYAEKLKDYTACRSLESVAKQIMNKASNLTVSRGELIQEAQSMLADINTEQATDSLSHIHDAATSTYVQMHHKLDAFAKGETTIKGIQTGIHDLDRKLGDIEPGSLLVLAARPAMGKTTMLQTISSHVAIFQNKPALIMSGEMPMEQIAMRMCCAIGPADIGKVRNAPHELTSDEFTAYQKAVTLLQSVPMMINDTSRPSIANVRESMRKMKHKYGSVGAVFVDYLQIMKTTKAFAREDLKIAYFTGELKALAKEFDCVVVVLSQLNRELEKRPNKRPVMSDLRESGAIEQDADQIVFLYRDEVYHKESNQAGIAEAIISKNRHGELGTAYMHAQLKYCQFSNLDSQAIEQIQSIGGGV